MVFHSEKSYLKPSVGVEKRFLSIIRAFRVYCFHGDEFERCLITSCQANFRNDKDMSSTCLLSEQITLNRVEILKKCT